MRQLIIARKDLEMSPGKLASQVAHASMAFLVTEIKENAVEVREKNARAVFSDGRKMDAKSVQQNSQPDTLEEKSQRVKALFFKEEEGESDFSKLAEFEFSEKEKYRSTVEFEKDVFEEWFMGLFTKTVCKAKNRTHLMKAVSMAEEMGMKEGKDFFLIKDACLTELTPEEIDENGQGRVLTCIGFRPLPDDVAHTISRKYQLYT